MGRDGWTGVVIGMQGRQDGTPLDMGEQAIVITGITIDPGVIPEDGTATITIDARSAYGWPLEFELSASEGTIEPTSRPNVFLWHGPRRTQEPSVLQKRPRLGARGAWQ